MRALALAVVGLLGCGQVALDEMADPSARGHVDAQEPDAGAQPGTGGAMAQAGAGGAPGAAGGAPGTDAGPPYVQPTYSCSATLLATVLPDGGPPADTGAAAFQNFGGACAAGGGECLAAAKIWRAAYPASSRQFGEQCSADYGIPGPGFCTAILPPASWDTSCAVIHADQVPPGWHCCNSLQKTAMFVPASCGCP